MESQFVWISPSPRGLTHPLRASTWEDPAEASSDLADEDVEDTEEIEEVVDIEMIVIVAAIMVVTDIETNVDTRIDTTPGVTDFMTDLLLPEVDQAMIAVDMMIEDMIPMDLLPPHMEKDQEGLQAPMNAPLDQEENTDLEAENMRGDIEFKFS